MQGWFQKGTVLETDSLFRISLRNEFNFSRSDKSFFKMSMYFFTGIEDPFFTIRVGSDIGYLDIPLSGIVDQ